VPISAGAGVVHFATHGLVAGETALFAENRAEPALLLTPVGRNNLIEDIIRELINVMEASEHRYCDDLLTLSAPTGRRCCRRAGRALPDRTMRAPVVEIAEILAQDLLQMALIEYDAWSRHSILTEPALGDRVSAGRPERCADLDNP